MSPEIKAKLYVRGFAARTAEALGKSKSTVSQVISGTCVSLPVATSIAKLIGVPIHIIWPNIPNYQPGFNANALRAKQRAAETALIKQQLAS